MNKGRSLLTAGLIFLFVLVSVAVMQIGEQHIITPTPVLVLPEVEEPFVTETPVSAQTTAVEVVTEEITMPMDFTIASDPLTCDTSTWTEEKIQYISDQLTGLQIYEDFHRHLEVHVDAVNEADYTFLIDLFDQSLNVYHVSYEIGDPYTLFSDYRGHVLELGLTNGENVLIYFPWEDPIKYTMGDPKEYKCTESSK